jgi:hypothetical protein
MSEIKRFGRETVPFSPSDVGVSSAWCLIMHGDYFGQFIKFLSYFSLINSFLKKLKHFLCNRAETSSLFSSQSRFEILGNMHMRLIVAGVH